MALKFLNPSRSYDAKKNQIQFWGHDGTFEISFLVACATRTKVDPNASDSDESQYLDAFDAALEKIQAAARRAYANKRQSDYFIAAEDI